MRNAPARKKEMFCRGRNGAVLVFSKSYAKRRKAFKIEDISIYKGEKR